MANQEYSDLEQYARQQDFTELREELRSDLRQMENRFSNAIATLSEKIDRQKKSLIEYVPAGMLMIALFSLALAPAYYRTGLAADRIDRLEDARISNAYTRGQHDERFRTLSGHVTNALENRQALHDLLQAEIQTVENELNVVRRELDNGLGHRIDEKMEPMERDLEWMRPLLERHLLRNEQ